MATRTLLKLDWGLFLVLPEEMSLDMLLKCQVVNREFAEDGEGSHQHYYHPNSEKDDNAIGQRLEFISDKWLCSPPPQPLKDEPEPAPTDLDSRIAESQASFMPDTDE